MKWASLLKWFGSQQDYERCPNQFRLFQFKSELKIAVYIFAAATNIFQNDAMNTESRHLNSGSFMEVSIDLRESEIAGFP